MVNVLPTRDCLGFLALGSGFGVWGLGLRICGE